jgi:hypothetical protein
MAAVVVMEIAAAVHPQAAKSRTFENNWTSSI